MKLVFCSNYMNHHQLYLAKAFIAEGIDYTFIACEKIEQERLDNGWEDMNSKYDFIVKLYESKELEEKAKKIIYNADLVISGSFPMSFLRKRIFSFKPVFLYSERLFKNSSGDLTEFMTFHNFCSNLLHRTYFNFFNIYMLCSSAYTSYDLSLYHNLKNKCFKWGYFPKVDKYDIDEVIANRRSKDKINILWVARLIQLKHPENMIYIAKRLKEDNYNFDINMIGIGEEYESIQKNIELNNLSDKVHLLGAMSNEDVKKYMLSSDIFLFTSDFNEGWGAVLNESMNSGCAVVASHSIGSVPFLINDGVNGFIYNFGDLDEMYLRVKTLIDNKELRENMGKEAYYTIINEWNPQNAAKKLIMLYDKLVLKKDIEIKDGVCSKAEILCNNWRNK